MSRWPSLRQKRKVFDLIGYYPFNAQWPIHESHADVLQIVGAEGGGKSRVTAAEVMAAIPWSNLVYIVGQTYNQTQAEFNYLVEDLTRLDLVYERHISQPRFGAWQMTTRTGCHIVTLSVERGASSIIARGQQPDIICLSEAGIINSYSVFTASVRRATRARGRVIASGTLKDDFGWYAFLVDELQPEANELRGETFSLPAWINTALYPLGRDDPEIKRLQVILGEDEFARTVAAKRMPPPAAVFGKDFTYARNVKPCPFEPKLPVYLFVDPGHFPSAYAVAVMQFHGREIWQIDEIYVHHHTHEEVIEKAQRTAWWYKVESGVIDVAGRRHTPSAKKSAVEVWQAAGVVLHSQNVGIMDGISVHRQMLRTGRLKHDESCSHTLAEYKKYRRPTDRDGNPTADLPKDEDNHAMKALAYGLVWHFGLVERKGPGVRTVAERDRIEAIDESEW